MAVVRHLGFLKILIFKAIKVQTPEDEDIGPIRQCVRANFVKTGQTVSQYPEVHAHYRLWYSY